MLQIENLVCQNTIPGQTFEISYDIKNLYNVAKTVKTYVIENGEKIIYLWNGTLQPNQTHHISFNHKIYKSSFFTAVVESVRRPAPIFILTMFPIMMTAVVFVGEKYGR